MLQKDIKVGRKYTAKVSGKLTTVRVDGIDPPDRYGIHKTRFRVTNLSTGRRIAFKSAARFRREVKQTQPIKDPAEWQNYLNEQAKVSPAHQPSGDSYCRPEVTNSEEPLTDSLHPEGI